MNKLKVIPEKIHLAGIRILKSHFEVDPSAVDSPEIIEKIKTGLKSESGFNLEDNYQSFRLFVKIQGYNKKEEKISVRGEYHIDFHFFIDNLKDFITEEADSDQFSVASELGATIAGISYSTSRGIILDRTQTTDFNGVILPVINPHKLLKEDSFTDMGINDHPVS